jgi:hypothetical protein
MSHYQPQLDLRGSAAEKSLSFSFIEVLRSEDIP